MRNAGGLVPGSFVRNPAAPDWGIGQVQSAIGSRITVNFEHAGKRLINGDAITLEPVALEPVTLEPTTQPGTPDRPR